MEVIILLHVHAFDRIAMAGQLSSEACSRLIRSARSRKRKIGSSHWIMATQFRRFIRQHDRDRYWIFIDWALCARCHTFWTIAHQRWFDVCVRKGAAVAIDIYRSIDHTISCWHFLSSKTYLRFVQLDSVAMRATRRWRTRWQMSMPGAASSSLRRLKSVCIDGDTCLRWCERKKKKKTYLGNGNHDFSSIT